MDRQDFYEKLQSSGIDITLTIGLEDVIETLKPKEVDQIVNFIKDMEYLSLASKNNEPYEELERRKNEDLKRILEDVKKIPVFDASKQSKEDFLRSNDFDSIQNSWKQVRYKALEQIYILSCKENQLRREIKDLRYAVEENKKKIEIIENDTNKKDYLNDVQRSERKAMIDAIKGENDILEEKIARIEDNVQATIKEHMFQTILNNYARTKVSQISSLQREKTLLVEREKIAEEQRESLKEIEKSKNKNENILERVGRYGHSIKCYMTNRSLEALDQNLSSQIRSVKNNKQLIDSCKTNTDLFTQNKINRWKKDIEKQQMKIMQTIEKMADRYEKTLEEIQKFEENKEVKDIENQWVSFREGKIEGFIQDLLKDEILTKEQFKSLEKDLKTLGFEIDISEHGITIDSMDLKDSMGDFEIER